MATPRAFVGAMYIARAATPSSVPSAFVEWWARKAGPGATG
jgi:hypothetical protein